MKKYLLLLIVPMIAFANIGKVTALKGKATISRDSNSISIVLGQVIEKNDFITTQKNSKIQIVFNDNTVFTVGQNSTLEVADFLYDEKKPQDNKAQFNVLKGAFSSITGRIGKLNKKRFKLKTKSASIGIRGTIVKANQNIIMCTSGAIKVTTNNGLSVNVNAGYKTNVSNGVPSTPSVITSTDIDTIEDTNSGDKKSDDSKEKVSQVQDNKEDSTKNAFTGYSVAADGTKESVYSETKNVGGVNLPTNSSLIMTDDAGIETDTLQSEVITWGHWADDTSTKWVAGQATSTQTMDNIRNATNTVDAQYNGKMMGTTNNGGDILINNNNKVQMNFSLGGGKNSFTGTTKFDTQNGQTWNSSFNGESSENSFTNKATSGYVTGTNVSGGTQAIDNQSGNIQGKFYGSNAQAVGGTLEINANNANNKAVGVFKATK